MTTYWRCYAHLLPARAVECHAGGVYEQSNSGGAAEKPTKTTGHPTFTSMHPFRRDLP